MFTSFSKFVTLGLGGLLLSSLLTLPLNAQTSSTTPIYFIDLAKISFNPAKNAPKVYKTAPVTITLTDSALPVGSSCVFTYRPYNITSGQSTAFATWAGSTAPLQNGTCSVTLPAELQSAPRFDFQVRVTDPANPTRVYGSDFSYFFLYGAIGVVNIIVTST